MLFGLGLLKDCNANSQYGDLRSLFESDTRLLGQFKWLLQEVG